MTLDKEDIYDIAKAVVKVIEDKDMMKSEENDCTSEKAVLQTLNAGDIFKAAGYEWIVLNQFKVFKTCFCIMKDFWVVQSHSTHIVIDGNLVVFVII